MTDNEIIKALECCTNDDNEPNCEECTKRPHIYCICELLEEAYGLIQRQRTEIEVLKKKADAYDSYPMKVLVGHNSEVYSKTWEDYIDFISDVAAEGVKEFADKIVEQLEKEKSDWNDDYNVPINRAIEIVKGVQNE